jgi:hypothetical protein
MMQLTDETLWTATAEGIACREAFQAEKGRPRFNVQFNPTTERYHDDNGIGPACFATNVEWDLWRTSWRAALLSASKPAAPFTEHRLDAIAKQLDRCATDIEVTDGLSRQPKQLRLDAEYLRKLAACPAAPAQSAEPVAFRQRVEHLLVELHNEGRLSEGQCAKVLDIHRIEWRKIVDDTALSAPQPSVPAQSGEPCKCQRLGDFDGVAHHPLCNKASAPAAVAQDERAALDKQVVVRSPNGWSIERTHYKENLDADQHEDTTYTLRGPDRDCAIYYDITGCNGVAHRFLKALCEMTADEEPAQVASPAIQLTDAQSRAIDAVCAELAPKQVIALGDQIEALRSIQWTARAASPQSPKGDERAALDDVAPVVDEWIRARGTSMTCDSYIAAVQLAAHVKARTAASQAGAWLTVEQRSIVQSAADTAHRVLCAGGDYGDELSDSGLRRELTVARDALRSLLSHPTDKAEDAQAAQMVDARDAARDRWLRSTDGTSPS